MEKNRFSEYRQLGSLANRYIVPPFSVLDAGQDRWREGQTKWLPIFDPLLCEIIYRWHMPTKGGGHVLDPFASDATRGIVAGCLGYKYTGLERSRKRIASYERQAAVLQAKYPEIVPPKWHCANPRFLDKHLPTEEKYDLIFTDVPIYGPKQTRPEYMRECEKVLQMAAARLKKNHFAIFMARAVRGDDGFIKFTSNDVVRWFPEALGLHYYNEGVLQMSGNNHEALVCFYNGEDKKDIPKELGILDQIEDEISF